MGKVSGDVSCSLRMISRVLACASHCSQPTFLIHANTAMSNVPQVCVPNTKMDLSADAGAWVGEHCLERWGTAPQCALRDVADLVMRKLHRTFGDMNSVLSNAPKELAASLARNRRARGFNKISSLVVRPPKKPKPV